MFITFEGGEGSGKTTQINSLVSYLDDLNIDYISTRQPGGTATGNKIREIILNESGDSDEQLTPMAELLLYMADRSLHVDNIIRPALTSGKTVLCDRYIDSSVVYQGVARGLGVDLVSELNNIATGGLTPDLTIYLDIDPAVGLARSTGSSTDRIENEAIEFHESLRQGYLELAAIQDRFRVVDAAKSEDEVRDEIIKIVKTKIKQA